MNKIIVEKEKVLNIKDNAIDLDIKTDELTINVEGMVLINEFCKKDENINLTINVESNSSLLYNRLIVSNKVDNKIVINKNSKSNVIFNYSMLVKDDSKISFDGNIDDDANINVRILNYGNKVEIINNLNNLKIINKAFDEIQEFENVDIKNGYLISNLDINNKMQKEIKELLGGDSNES